MRILSLCWALSLASAATLHNAEEIDTIRKKVEEQCSDIPAHCRAVLSALGSDFQAGVLRQSTQALDEAMLKFQKDAKSAKCVGVMNDCATKIKQVGRQ